MGLLERVRFEKCKKENEIEEYMGFFLDNLKDWVETASTFAVILVIYMA